MYKLLFALLAAGTVTGSAHAADTFFPVQNGYDWSGFYAGVGAGAGGGVHKLSIPGEGSLNGLGGEGVFGEVTVGYDHMFTPRFLGGIYADARFGNIGPALDIEDFDASANADYGFDVLARAGYLVTPRTLVYALGGYSWQHFDVDADEFGEIYDWNSSGIVLGLGMETVIREKWTLKGEYRYSHYGTETIENFLDVDPSFHTFHVGLNYRFNGGSTAGGFATPAYDWTGFHVGAAVGAGALVHEIGVGGGFASLNGLGAEGVFGEISMGYDRELGNGLVVGVMADARLSGIASELVIDGLGSASVDADYGFDILGRIGTKLDEATLVYALGGYSWQHFDVNTSPGGSVYDWDASGFTVGAGIETALSEKMAVNLEYRYAQYADEDFGTDGLFTTDPSSHTVRIGIKRKLF